MQSKRKAIVLVVGGAGYIGSHVNQLLYQRGYFTVVFDNLSRGILSNVVGGDFILGDIGNQNDLAKLFSTYQFDAVMHFAGLTDVGESFIAPEKYYRENVVYALQLLNAAMQNGVKAFVFSSSAAIFGLPHSELIDESHPRDPISPYGNTKLMFERILSDYDTAHGIKSCCLRYFNAAGNDPELKIKSSFALQKNLIPLIFQSLQKHSPLTIYGTDYPTVDGTCIRDYIHVADLAEAHLKGLEKIFTDGKSCSYNLGNGRGYSVKEVLKTIETVSGLKVIANEGPRRPGDPPFLLADSNKAHKELGWAPRYPDLETMIRHAWNTKLFTKNN